MNIESGRVEVLCGKGGMGERREMDFDSSLVYHSESDSRSSSSESSEASISDSSKKASGK